MSWPVFRRAAFTVFIKQQQRQLTIGNTALNWQRILNANSTTLCATTTKPNTIVTIRSHKNFGHQEDKTPKVTKFYHLFVGTLFLIAIIDWRKRQRRVPEIMGGILYSGVIGFSCILFLYTISLPRKATFPVPDKFIFNSKCYLRRKAFIQV